MRNGFLNNYNSKTKTTFSYFDKNEFKTYINNSTNANFLATNRINKLKNDIRSRYQNNHSKKKLKNYSYKTGQMIGNNISNDKRYLREFEDLFEKTTNYNIVEYFNGRKVEKMEDFVKRIREFNYSDFIKKLKKRKSKNKKAYNNYKPRNSSSLPYNYKGCSYSISTCRTSINENNCYDIYLRIASLKTSGKLEEEKKNKFEQINDFQFNLNDYASFNPKKKEIKYTFDKIGAKNLGANKKPSLNKNQSNRIKLFRNEINLRNFSSNSKKNKNKVDNYLIYHYKTHKNLNLNYI